MMIHDISGDYNDVSGDYNYVSGHYNDDKLCK